VAGSAPIALSDHDGQETDRGAVEMTTRVNP